MRHRQSSKIGPSVGLEITPTDLRAVEVKLHGRETVIQRLAQIEAPEGSVRGGRVVEPAALADGLRRLWGKGGFSTRRCVVAVPAGALTQQMLTVPPAPAAEQRLIVRGELARFAPENEFAPFGWMPMASGGGPGGNTLAFLAETGVIAGYQQALSLAGLEMDACEPDATAALRALALGLRQPGPAAAVYVSESCSEMAFLEAGRVRYYRRLDPGHASREKAGAPLWPPVENDPEELHLTRSLAQQGSSTVFQRSHEEELGALALEIKRSVQYYGRAYADAPQPQRVLLLGDDAILARLAPMIPEKLQLPAECLHLLRQYPAAPGHMLDPLAGGGSSYDVALGLALRPLADPHSGSALDLTARDGAQILARHAPRYLMAALSGSSLLVLAALAVSLPLGARLGQVQNQLRAAEAEQRADSADQIASAARRQQVQTATDRLRKQAMPVPQLLTRLGEMVPETVAITDVQLKEDGSLVLEGDARMPLQVNGFLQRLSDDARFLAPNLDTLDASGQQGVAHFRVQTGLVGYGKGPKKENA